MPAPPTVCLIVPAGTWPIDRVAAAVTEHNAACRVVAVWGGDPHRRPARSGVEWIDVGLPEPTGTGWGRLLIALDPRVYEWSRLAAAVTRLLDDGADPVVILRVGSVAVLGDVGVLQSTAGLTVVPRIAATGLASDGLAPSEADLHARGRFSTVLLGLRPGAQAALRWLADQLLDVTGDVGPLIERWGERFQAATCDDAAICVAGWRLDEHPRPTLIDLDDVDRAEPWHFGFRRRARVRLSEHAPLAATIAAARDQIAGTSDRLALPGGLVVDDSMRALVRAALSAGAATDTLPPEPFGAHHSAFVLWLETPDPPWSAQHGRYWRRLRDDRTDLQVAFPEADGADQERYAEWIGASWRFPGGTALLRRTSGHGPEPLLSVARDVGGLNVVGYHTHDFSLGLVAREAVAALASAGVSAAAIDHHRTGSPVVADPPETTREVRFATNLVVVNADQFEFLIADHGAALLPGRRTIGYWFWELETVPAPMVAAIDFVDEIWVGTRFVRDAFAESTTKPVRVVPIPVREPQPSDRSRQSFGLPPDRFVFLVTFDHFSVTERKNPFGAIAAFRAAFADGEGPLLVIKTVNGDIRWSNHERLLVAASGRSDIQVWDEHLSRADQMAVHRAADCLVSLHRSEGLGLHCAEAMWLGRPVIATRYSGNLDFMDDTCAALIDFALVPVAHGEGVYEPPARWAEPDIDQAAGWMQRLASDPALATRLGAAGRTRMEHQPTLGETGALMARLAGLDDVLSAQRTAGSPGH